MDTSKGYIYILTNPSFPDYVKIGYADNVEARLKQLNSTECTPFAFRVYATYEVPARLADKGVHSIIDRLNPLLRASEMYNGKRRVREFYAMTPEEAYKIFEAMANIHACPERLRLIPASTEEKRDEEEAIKIEEETQERKACFSFELINIEPGEEVEFWYTSKTPSGIMCRVLNDRQVEYEGKPWSLSGLARNLTNAKNCVPGPHYFKYKGEWLNDIRARLGV